MKALSIRQPWAWLIVRPDLTDPAKRAAAFAAGEIKDIENRTWATKHRGPFLVHAGQTFDMEGYLWVRSRFPKIPLPPSAKLRQIPVYFVLPLFTHFNTLETEAFAWPKF